MVGKKVEAGGPLPLGHAGTARHSLDAESHRRGCE